MRKLFALLILQFSSQPLPSQARYTGPIVDVNVRVLPLTQERLREFDEYKVTHAVAFGPDSVLRAWSRQWKGQVIPSITLPCPARNCYPAGGDLPDPAWVRRELQSGRARALGELMQQFSGMQPSDPKLEPYFALAEEFDVPVGVHLSLAPTGATRGSPLFRTYLGAPHLIEDVLARHPKLRVHITHAGYPFAEEMIAILYIYPNVTVDVSAIAWPRLLPTSVFHDYLRRLVDLGFHNRIMFGSDVEAVGVTRQSVEAIQSATFLTVDHKRAIFCGNAQRVFRIADLKCD